MTERFSIVNMGLGGRFIKENGKIIELERVVDLLNENEKLKSEIEKITKYKERWAFISDCSIQVMNEEEKFKEDYLRIATNDLKKLQDENEQLKQRIKVLEDTIDGLTGTIAHFDLDEVILND